MSEKPFAATPHRLRQARSEGNVPKAQELATLLAFVGVAGIVNLTVGRLVSAAVVLLRTSVMRMSRTGLNDGRDWHVFLPSAWTLVAPIFVAIACGCGLSCAVALFASGAQLSPLRFKPDRLAPGPQLQQLFSGATVFAFARAALSAACAFACVVPFAGAMIAGSLALHSPLALGYEAWREIGAVLGVLACVGFAVATIEVAVSLRKRAHKLRMTHDELRRESKEQQGDPHLRSQRKRRHRTLLRGGVRAVRSATVVITNPTHVAIALRYAPPQIAVPEIVSAGIDQLAQEMRRVANAAGVPCVENVTLARYLWTYGQIGAPIPLDSYALVAPILAAVLSQTEQGVR